MTGRGLCSGWSIWGLGLATGWMSTAENMSSKLKWVARTFICRWNYVIDTIVSQDIHHQETAALIDKNRIALWLNTPRSVSTISQFTRVGRSSDYRPRRQDWNITPNVLEKRSLCCWISTLKIHMCHGWLAICISSSPVLYIISEGQPLTTQTRLQSLLRPKGRSSILMQLWSSSDRQLSTTWRTATRELSIAKILMLAFHFPRSARLSVHLHWLPRSAWSSIRLLCRQVSSSLFAADSKPPRKWQSTTALLLWLASVLGQENTAVMRTWPRVLTYDSIILRTTAT